MPKRTDIKKIMVIGSGPIVIGQAAEFDYAGTQACLALREEGYEVVLANSNPATIMTDTTIADKVYMEPLTPEYVARIIRYERPDAIVPGIGGQTGLNLAVALQKRRRAARVRRGDTRHQLREHRAGRGPREIQGAVPLPRRARAPQRDGGEHRRLPGGRRRASATPWCCARPSRWAARAAASRTTRPSCASWPSTR